MAQGEVKGQIAEKVFFAKNLAPDTAAPKIQILSKDGMIRARVNDSKAPTRPFDYQSVALVAGDEKTPMTWYGEQLWAAVPAGGRFQSLCNGFRRQRNVRRSLTGIAMIKLPTISLLLLLLACGGAPPAVEAPPEAAATAPADETASFIPADFEPPTLVQGDGFILKPLGTDVTEIDYKAYMASIEHLQTTFTHSTSWPHEGVTMEDAVKDMENEARRFTARESFAYAVLSPDGSVERGCVYVRPAGKQGYDAAVKLWVTKAEYDAGFDSQLYGWTRQWIDGAWPFEKVAYPDREIPLDEWKGLPDKATD